MDDAAWERSLDAAADLDATADVTSDPGCAGGTSEDLQLSDAHGEVVDVSVDHCASTAGPDLAAVVGELLAMFDLDQLLAT